MNKDYMQEEWFAILKKELEDSTVSAVAKKIGYSSTSISLIMHGKYNGKADRVAKKVLETFTKVGCPYLGQEVDMPTCIEIALSPAPTHNPLKMQHWKACLKCPKRPPEK